MDEQLRLVEDALLVYKLAGGSADLGETDDIEYLKKKLSEGEPT